jgi:hypothetical protein
VGSIYHYGRSPSQQLGASFMDGRPSESRPHIQANPYDLRSLIIFLKVEIAATK